MASNSPAVLSPFTPARWRMRFLVPVLGLCCWLAMGALLVRLDAFAASIPRYGDPGKSGQDHDPTEALAASLPGLDATDPNFRAALLRSGGTRLIPGQISPASLLGGELMTSLLDRPFASHPDRDRSCMTPGSSGQPLPRAILVPCGQTLVHPDVSLLAAEVFPLPHALLEEARTRRATFLLGWAVLGIFLAAPLVPLRRVRAATGKPQKAHSPPMDEELARNQEHAAIYAAMQEGMVILKQTRVVSCNSSFAYTIGLEPDMVTGMDYSGFVHQEDVPLLDQALMALQEETRNPPRFSLRFATGLGDVRWATCTLSRITWQGERAALLYVLDMTALRQTEHESEFAKAQLKALLDAVPLGLAVFDAFGSLVSASASWTKIWGDPTGGGMRRVTMLEAHESFPAPVAKALSEALDGRQITLRHVECQSPWGETLWLSISLIPLRDTNEKILGALMLQDDISGSVRQARTELELTAQATQGKYELLRLRDHMTAVMDSSPSAIIGVDEDRRITSWNSMAETRFGLPRQEAVGLSFGAADRTLARHDPLVRKALRERIFLQISRVPYTKNGNARYEDVSIYPIETNLETGGIIRIDDVTKRIRLEESLARADRLSAVGMLAAGMAHEVNNPLSAILQGVQNLERRLLRDMAANREAAEQHGASFDTLQEYMRERRIPQMLESIQDSGRHMGAIVTNMLRFNRRHDPVRMPADVNALVARSLEFAASDQKIRHLGDFSAITVTRDFQPDLPQVLCSENDILQVLLQLLRTCMHALRGRSGGDAPAIHLQTRRENMLVSITVTDNGPGMPPQVCRRIFEPFYTTHNMGQGGADLGLSLAFFIITTVHKGTLDCTSSPGRGTTFTIRLPAVRAEQTNAPDR